MRCVRNRGEAVSGKQLFQFPALPNRYEGVVFAPNQVHVEVRLSVTLLGLRNMLNIRLRDLAIKRCLSDVASPWLGINLDGLFA